MAVVVILVHLGTVQHCKCIVDEHTQRVIEGDQVGCYTITLDSGEADRETHTALITVGTRVEETDNTLAFFADPHQQELRLAVLQGNFVRGDQGKTAPGDEL